MTPEQIAFLNALLNATPGKNQAQKLNYLQDLGFDPFGKANSPYVSSQPAPQAVNTIGETYGNSPVFAKIFNLINSGQDPFSAVEAVRKEHPDLVPTYTDASGTASSNTPASQQVDFYGIASKFAEENAKNAMAQQEWNQKDEAARAQWEADQKPTLNNVFDQTQYSKVADILGTPDVTTEKLLAAYQHANAGNVEHRGQPTGVGGRRGMAGAHKVDPQTFRDQIFTSGPASGYARLLAKQMIDPKIAKAKQSYDLNPKVQDLLSMLIAQRNG